MAGGFGEADVARNRGLVEQFAEEGLSSLDTPWARLVRSSYMVRTTPSTTEAGVEGLADAFDGVEELADAFEGEVFGLHGDEDGVGGDQGVEGEQVEGGRTVEDDDVKLVANGLQGVAEAVFAEFGVDQLDDWLQ